MQVAQVLEGLLELVLGQHIGQVAGVRHGGQLLDGVKPAHLGARMADGFAASSPSIRQPARMAAMDSSSSALSCP